MPSLKDTRFLLLDVETTGLDLREDRIVQIALVSVLGGAVKLVYNTLVNPLRPIPSEVSAVHHITDKMVESAPPWSTVWPTVQRFLTDVDVVVAHNAAFDKSFAPASDKPWLCTKRLAQHLWPEMPNFKNQTLRYALGLDLQAAAHDAAGDTLVTGYILVREIEAYLQNGGVDEDGALIALAGSQIAVQRMPFGKHYGKLLTEVPRDYLQYMLRKATDMDADLRWSMESVLQQAVSA
ncbi:MAG: putative quorum-sensing-regulated virulence factor [Bacilli bacterium]